MVGKGWRRVQSESQCKNILSLVTSFVCIKQLTFAMIANHLWLSLKLLDHDLACAAGARKGKGDLGSDAREADGTRERHTRRAHE